MPTIPPLVSPKFNGLALLGKGFAPSSSPKDLAALCLATARARILQNDGVLRIDFTPSPMTCHNLHHYVLEQWRLAEEALQMHVNTGNDADALGQIYYGSTH